MDHVYPFQRPRPYDPPAEYALLRRTAPISQVTAFDGATVWLVTGHHEVKAALADPRLSRRELRELACRAFEAGSGDDSAFDFGVTVADPPGHTRWRRVVNGAFGARQAEAMRGRVASLVDALLDGLPAPEFDFMAEFAFRLPLRVLCELLDVPAADRALFDEWGAAIRNVGGSLDNFGAAMRSLGRYAAELVERRRRCPGRDDLVSALIALGPGDGGGTTAGIRASQDSPDGSWNAQVPMLVRTLLLVVLGGYETTGVQLGNGLFALLRHPSQLDVLRREPELLPGAVEELLRYAHSSTGLASALRATADIELDGVTIPAGATVFVSQDSANHDDSVFECPELFDVRRAGAGRHLTFGSGAHFCLGAPLARVQLQEAFGGLLRRFPTLRLAVEPDEVEFTSNLFSHYPRVLPVTLGP